ncbi:MAG: sensor histidine kinase [Haloarculaceae archaeon]
MIRDEDPRSAADESENGAGRPPSTGEDRIDACATALVADGGRPSEFFRQVVEQVGVGVAVYDETGQFTYANDAYADLLGMDCEAVTDARVWTVNPRLDASQFADYWSSFDLGETRQRETVHVRADGTEVPVETHTTAVEIGDAVYHVGTIADISERIEGWEELERQDEHIERFASVVSHDLRNPLNVAMGRIRLVEEECDSEQIQPVKDALGRMEELIDDVLTLAREGNRVTDPEPVSLARAAETAWSTAGAPGATLDLDALDGLEAIRSDESRLTTLFENLFDNAVSHVGPDVTITVGRLPDGFYVQDDGPGIPPEDRDAVFEYGYSTADGGTGFGLTIVEEIAHAHGWRVDLTEGEAGGARFEFHAVETA